MIEAVWIILLAFACRDERARDLAGLLVAKWLANYATFLFVSEQMPLLVDLLFGTAGVCLAARTRPLFASLFVMTVLVRATYWTLWDIGVWMPNLYYWTLIVLFTWQILLIGPWRRAWDACRDGLDWARRGAMARGLASALGGQAARDRNPARCVTPAARRG